MEFKGGKLILTVGIEANEATLAFGGAAGAGNQTSSGIQAKLTGILGTFDIAVDIAKAAGAISNPAKLLEAFERARQVGPQHHQPARRRPERLQGHRRRPEGRLRPELRPRDQGPAGDPHAAERADRVPAASASRARSPSTSRARSQTTIPGLTIWDNGFRLGRAELIYKPGVIPQELWDTAAGQPCAVAGTPATCQLRNIPGATPAPGTIKFGSILEFDDLRVGVTNFEVRFGQQFDFTGTIYFASGGVKFLPGKPVSATIIDRLTAEPTDTAARSRTPRRSALSSSSAPTARSRRSCSTPTRCGSRSARS